ncbi:MAG: GNAT family N-acetyltransferase [Pseudomonadota bacterium]
MIRRATPDDAEAVGALYRASYPEGFKSAYDVRTCEVFLPILVKPSNLLLRSGRFYVLEREGGQVACGGWSVEDPGTGEVEEGVGHIRHLAVHPACWGRSFGAQLVLHCLAAARDAGHTRMKVASSLNAAGFYARMGFVPVGQAILKHGRATFVSTRMVREL